MLPTQNMSFEKELFLTSKPNYRNKSLHIKMTLYEQLTDETA